MAIMWRRRRKKRNKRVVVRRNKNSTEVDVTMLTRVRRFSYGKQSPENKNILYWSKVENSVLLLCCTCTDICIHEALSTRKMTDLRDETFPEDKIRQLAKQ